MPDHETERDPVSAGKTAKRLKACVCCREQKLRCSRNEYRPQDGCERCIVAGRQCVVPDPVRKRKPRLMNRHVAAIATLESKVDALVAALEKRSGGKDELQDGTITEQPHLGEVLHPLHVGDKSRGDHLSDASVPLSFPETTNLGSRREVTPIRGAQQYSFPFFLPRTSEAHCIAENDVIGQNIISLKQAEEIFARFTDVMLPHFPVIVFPPDTTVSVLRCTRPTLLLAILGAASGFMGDRVQARINSEVTEMYADRIFIKGEKNLDLIQALQISALWYFPPEHIDEVKIYQLIHLAALMAIELGIAQPSRVAIARFPGIRHARRGNLGQKDVVSIGEKREQQRALLVSYVLCSIESMLLRRPGLLRWSSYIGICVNAIQETHDISAADLCLCEWVKIQHIAEEISDNFFTIESPPCLDMSNLGTKYILKSLERQLEQFEAHMPLQIQTFSPGLIMQVNIVNLYLHEIFLHAGYDLNDPKLPPTAKGDLEAGSSFQLRLSDPIQQNGLAICITSVKKTLDIFLGLDLDALCSVPVFTYARAAYAIFAMMKIYFTGTEHDSNPQSMLNQKGDESLLNIQLYLDRILGSLERVIQRRQLRVAGIFRLILLVLRTWFQNQHKVPMRLDEVPMGFHRNDNIVQTVLDMAERASSDEQYDHHEKSAIERPIVSGCETDTFDSGAALPSTTGNLPLVAGMFTQGFGAEMSFWDGTDLAALFDFNEPEFLQSALEAFGGVFG